MLPTPELEIARNLPAAGCSPEEAQRYTRWLATHHYENFNVVSWLLPRHLHQHFYNLYAYCRWSDDLGDEIPDRRRSLELLDAWEEELALCYSAERGPSHPVLIALRETIHAKDIPQKPFSDLLRAFRQDQRVQRYATWDGVLDYCVYSANPVGRLVLYLCGYRDAERQKLSDATCTALQLANFWQDVSRDLEKGRIYIPLDAAAEHGLTERDIVERRFDERYVRLMKDFIARTRTLFAEGAPLAKMVDRRLSIDLDMFTRGGVAVLDAIEAMGYDTLHQRPSVSKAKQAGLLGRAFVNYLTSDRRQTKSVVAATEVIGAQHAAPLPALATDLAAALVRETLPRKWVSGSYDNCHAIARASHSSFYPAFFLLPKQKRDGIVALYAFMRVIDDVADEGHDVAAKQRGLAKWRAELDEAV